MQQSPPTPHAIRRLYCSHCGFIIDAPVDCGDRFCNICSRRRAFRVRNRLRWLLHNSAPSQGYVLKMVTLSMPNCKQLDAGVRMLVQCFRRLRQSQIWLKNVEGGATIIEVKGRPNSWHPHLHILCYSRRLPWHPLRDRWTQISGGTACYIQNVNQDKALYYVTKYITKVDVPEFLEYSVGTVLKKFRLFQRFGSWHSLKIPKKLFDYPCPTCTKSIWVSDIFIDQSIRALHRGS